MSLVDQWIELLRAIHRAPDWPALILFYGVVVGLALFICLQLQLVSARRKALRAMREVRKMMADIRGLAEQIDDLERRIERRFDTRAGELDERMTRKLDQKGDLIQERLEQNRTDLQGRISTLDVRVQEATERVETFRRRVDEVEARVPGLFDRIDEFREGLARTFQAELGSVLNSFDNSIGAVLEEMKSELQLGISRIESIESMVGSRKGAERALLGAPEAPRPAEGPPQEEEEFEEWGEEAKELAEEITEQQEAAEPQPEERTGSLEHVPVEREGPADYPEEMADNESDLYVPGAEEIDLEGEDEAEEA